MNLTEKIIVLFETEKTEGPQRINTLLNCIAIEMAFHCKDDPLSDEVCGQLLAGYVSKVKRIVEIASNHEMDN